MPKTVIDLSAIETRRAELRCPQCGRWTRRLLVTLGGRTLCQRCAFQRPAGDAA